jgi:integrase
MACGRNGAAHSTTAAVSPPEARTSESASRWRDAQARADGVDDTLDGAGVAGLQRLAQESGDRRLSEVQRCDVQDLADKLTAEGLSASTVQNTLDPLRVIYRRAIRGDEGVTIDPTDGLELRRPDGWRERVVKPVEAAELIAAIPDDERALWTTAFYAGLRRGELRALRWADMDLPARVIHVKRGWDAVEGEQDVKSAAGRRRVPILDPLASELAAHQTRTGRSGDALVFGRTATRPIQPGNVASKLARSVGLAGSP